MARIPRRRPVQRGSKLRSPRTGGDHRPQPALTKPDRWQRFTAVAGIVSVLLVGVGLVLTNDFNRDQLALQQTTAQQQQDLALKGQRAERFIGRWTSSARRATTNWASGSAASTPSRP
jgi:hypothetical protein